MLQLAGRSRKDPLYGVLPAILLAACGAVACRAPEHASEGFGAADPISLDIASQVLASGQDRLGFAGEPDLTPSLIADDSGVYWFDQRGSVFGQRRGEAQVVELLAGVESFYDSLGEGRVRVVVGLTAAADRLFAGDGYAIDDYEFIIESPPSRLLSIPKQGGPTSVLLESETELLYPVAVDGERLIVLGVGAGAPRASTYQVSLANPALVPLPATPVPNWLKVSGGHIYWTENRRLWRAGFDGQPERLMELFGDDFWVCPGYFLARLAGETFGSLGKAAQTLFLQDAESGRGHPFSRLGWHISGAACDARHVYYYSSYPLDGAEEDGQLVRVDVESGQLARLSSPDLSHSGITILGEDAENIYVNDAGTILAVRKP